MAAQHHSSRKSYQGTLPPEEWKALLSDLEHRHWRESLQRTDCPILAQKRNWFTNRGKALFYRQLRPLHMERFLDIGAGSGVISAALRDLYRSGVALDYAAETTRFMEIRFRQDSHDNIDVVRGNGLSLPFRSGAFDLIVMNGVLEWVSFFTRGRSCRSVQRRFLEETRRCLSKGGKVAIAIENRWALQHFLGGSPHGEPAYVAVLPRILARTVHRLVRGSDYRTYIYTCFGYGRLLRSAGFTNVNTFIAVPDYYAPRRAAPMNKAEIDRICAERSAGLSRKRATAERILNSLGLLKFFLPAFYIAADNDDAPSVPTGR